MSNLRHVNIHTCVDGAYGQLEKLQLVGALRFPERQGGPDSCLRQLLDVLEHAVDIDVITAYPDIINFVGEGIYLKRLTGTVYLYYPDGLRTTHQFDVGGCLTDDWPFGCLSPDTDEHSFRLKKLVDN